MVTTSQQAQNQALRMGAILLLVLLTCCSQKEEHEKKQKEKPDYYALEQNQIDTLLYQDDVINNYRALKSMVRALGAEESSRPEFLQAEHFEVLKKYATVLYRGEQINELDLFKDVPSLMILQAFYSDIPSHVYSLKEDDFPTLAESLSESSLNEELSSWNNSYEHAVLALLMQQASIEEKYEFYELNLIKPEEIEDNEFDVLLTSFKAMKYLEMDFPYHAYAELDSAQRRLDIQEHFSGSFTRSWLNVQDSTNQKTRENFTALLELCKGLACTKMEDKSDQKRAIEHYANFSEISSQQGVLSEWQLLSEVVLLMNKDEEVSDDDLNKLLSADGLSFTEKSRLLNQLQGLKSGVDRDDYIRNIIIPGIVMQKLYVFYQESHFFESIQTNKSLKGLLQMPESLDNLKAQITSLQSLGNLL